jgi:hypothetical protein
MKTNLRDSVSTLRLENCALVILRDRECNALMYMVHYNLSTINRNRSSVLMVSVLFSTSAEERRFEPRSAETNELTMSVLVICPGGTPWAKRKCTKGQTIIYYRYIMEGARWMYIDDYFTQATVF